MAKKDTNPVKITQTVWNLNPLASSDNDPALEKKRQEVINATNTFVNKWKDRDDYLKDPVILRQALDEYEQWDCKYGTSGDEGYYFFLRSSQDENDPKIKAKVNKVDELSNKLSNEIQFFGMRIAKIPESEQKKFLEHPDLQKYHYHLEESFKHAKYLLSEPEEKILTLKSSPSYGMWVDMTSGFLSKEESVVLDEKSKKAKKSFSAIQSLAESNPNKKIRQVAEKAFTEILTKHADSAESELNAILYNKKIEDGLRGFTRPDQSRHISDGIETEVVDAMVDAVSSRYDISQRYYKLKAKLLGVKKLKYSERRLSYGKIEKKYNYNDSIVLVYKVFNNLDPKFSEILKGFVENAYIDVYPRKGKTSGAFCAHVLKSEPTYILLNHNEDLHDVLTIAHEVGHGINNELTREKQNALYFGTSTATAEVASTFMEDFVLEELLREADDNTRLSLLVQKLDDNVSTIMRQVACYKFETDLHKTFRENGHISKEEVCAMFKKNMENYMGPAVDLSEADYWWVYWGHIRRFFYVYSYASGLLISKGLQSAVHKDPKAIEKVKEFLAAGVSDSPKNIFLKTGIDISKKEFWLQGLEQVDELLKETEALAKKLKKI